MNRHSFRKAFFHGEWVERCGWNGFDFPDRCFDVQEYGTPADGIFPATAGIQSAIDACHVVGGGRVRVPTGRYLVGSLFLKSNVHLVLEEGAELLASMDLADYPEDRTRVAGVDIDWPLAVLNINMAENVRISGPGKVQGRGFPFWTRFRHMQPVYEANGLRWALDYDCKRPRMLVAANSRNIRLDDFTLEESAFWTVQVVYCEEVTIDGVTIRNNRAEFHGPSSDGIDIDSSRFVLVENCDVDCDDDNFCLKAGRDADGLRVNRPCCHVVIRNNRTGVGAGLVTFGSETSGGIHHVLVQNMRAQGTARGIRFKSARTRGGFIENILVEDVEICDVPFPFEFMMDWNPAYSYCRLPDAYVGREIPHHWKVLTEPVTPPERGICPLRNVLFANITVRGKCWKCFKVEGFSEEPIGGLVFENCKVETETGGEIRHACDWSAPGSSFRFEDGEPVEQENTAGLADELTGEHRPIP